MLCPCQSGQPYTNCCAPLHLGKTQAQSPKQLMSSRYCAFYLGAQGQNPTQMANYLIATQTGNSSNTHNELLENFKRITWQGLHIINSSDDSVEFSAFFTENAGNIQQHHEYSRFILQNQQWLYDSGDMLAPISFKRNTLCWCGSGKKFKHCHL